MKLRRVDKEGPRACRRLDRAVSPPKAAHRVMRAWLAPRLGRRVARQRARLEQAARPQPARPERAAQPRLARPVLVALEARWQAQEARLRLPARETTRA